MFLRFAILEDVFTLHSPPPPPQKNPFPSHIENGRLSSVVKSENIYWFWYGNVKGWLATKEFVHITSSYRKWEEKKCECWGNHFVLFLYPFFLGIISNIWIASLIVYHVFRLDVNNEAHKVPSLYHYQISGTL